MRRWSDDSNGQLSRKAQYPRRVGEGNFPLGAQLSVRHAPSGRPARCVWRRETPARQGQRGIDGLANADRDGKSFLDLFHDEIAFGLCCARQLKEDVAEQFAILIHVVDACLDQVIEVA